MNTSTAWLAAELHARTAPLLRSARRPERRPTRRLRGDRGEGVVSAAIAVLIMAFLGAAMWFGFQGLFNQTQSKIECNVNQIGGGAPAGAGAPNAC